MKSGDPAKANRRGYFWLLGVSPNFTEWPLGLPRLYLCSLGYRLGIAFDHFGTALVLGPAGFGALWWGRGVVGGWAGAGLAKGTDGGQTVCRICLSSRRAKSFAQMWHGLGLGLQMRCLLVPGCGAAAPQSLSALLLQELPEGT